MWLVLGRNCVCVDCCCAGQGLLALSVLQIVASQGNAATRTTRMIGIQAVLEHMPQSTELLDLMNEFVSSTDTHELGARRLADSHTTSDQSDIRSEETDQVCLLERTEIQHRTRQGQTATPDKLMVDQIQQDGVWFEVPGTMS